MKGLKFDANPKAYLIAGSVCFFGSGFSSGLLVGYAVCRKRLAEQFQARLDAEVADTKAYYATKLVGIREDVEAFNAQIDETMSHLKELDRHARSVHDEAGPELASDSGDEDDGDAAVGDRDELDGEDVPAAISGAVHVAEHEVGAPVAPDAVPDGVVRDTSKPYLISLAEFCDPPAGFQQLTITYYAADRVLVDEKDIPIQNVNKTTGPLSPLSFGGISEDPHLMYVRNHLLDCDFEVVLNAGSYADLILNYGRPGERAT